MPKFFQKLKKQMSKNSPQDHQLSSSVATQSEPLPTSYHLDALLNTSHQSPHSGEDMSKQKTHLRSSSVEEVDGIMLSQFSLDSNDRGSELEERNRLWTEDISLQEPIIYPTPSRGLPLTSTTTPSIQHHNTSYDSNTITTPTHLPKTTPTHQLISPTGGDCSPVLSSPTYPLLPEHISSPTVNTPPHSLSTDVVSTETKTAWGSTVVELKNVLDHVGKDKREGCHSDDEIKRCHAALQALHEREIRLMAEVTELKTELQPSKNKEEEKKIRRRRRKLQKTFSCPPISTHPEMIVADLEQCLKKTQETVQAVQCERDDFRDGVNVMEEELISLRRSNSILAKRKQEWMEVASQSRVVLEENNNLLTQHKNHQRIISELRTQHHSRVTALEKELMGKEERKKSFELQLKKLVDGQAVLFRQVSHLVGVAVGRANSPRHVASLLEKYTNDQTIERATQQEILLCLERENRLLSMKVADTKNVIKRLQSEMKDAEGIMKEGEEAVARLRGQLEEVQEREEISQQQLAHAITQVDKAMAERDAYGRIARRLEHSSSNTTSRALEEARHQLQQEAQEHKAQRKRYKTEIHRLRSLVVANTH